MFWYVLAALTAWVLAQGAFAYVDGWLLQRQLPEPKPKKYFVLWQHLPIWSDLLFINSLLAYILNKYAPSWSTPQFLAVLFVTSAGCLSILLEWLRDSKEVPSALARDGKPTVPGILHYMYMAFAIAVAIMYYVFTSTAVGDYPEVLLVTALLAMHWAVGLVQPPITVHGKVHKLAERLVLVGWAVLFIMATFHLSYMSR